MYLIQATLVSDTLNHIPHLYRRTCAADSIAWRNVCERSLERIPTAAICLCSVHDEEIV